MDYLYLTDHDDPKKHNDPVDEEKHQDSESKNDSNGDTVWTEKKGVDLTLQ